MSRAFLVLICSRLESLLVETMAAHRANSLLAILPNALGDGILRGLPRAEPLKVCP
jgi:hypothetical protein